MHGVQGNITYGVEKPTKHNAKGHIQHVKLCTRTILKPGGFWLQVTVLEYSLHGRHVVLYLRGLT